MDRMKTKSTMLMTKGFMDMRVSPPGVVCRIRTYHNPESNKRVTLMPVPNTARPGYLQLLEPEVLTKQYDKILCEDGRLPYDANGSHAARQIRRKRFLPFFAISPVVTDASKYDGVLQRDPFESRMAYQSVMGAMDPPVDPRARRAVERIDTYQDGTHVVCPWTVYHLVYFDYRLQKLGYVMEKEVEELAIGPQQILALMAICALLSTWMLLLLFRLIAGF